MSKLSPLFPLVAFIFCSVVSAQGTRDFDGLVEYLEYKKPAEFELRVNLSDSPIFSDLHMKESRLVVVGSALEKVSDGNPSRLTAVSNEIMTLIPGQPPLPEYRFERAVSLVPKSSIHEGRLIDVIRLNNSMADCDPLSHAIPYAENDEVKTYVDTDCADISTENDRKWVVRVWLRNLDQNQQTNGWSDLDVRKEGNPVSFDPDDTNVDKPCESGLWASRIRIVMERFLFARVVYDMTKSSNISFCPSE